MVTLVVEEQQTRIEVKLYFLYPGKNLIKNQ